MLDKLKEIETKFEKLLQEQLPKGEYAHDQNREKIMRNVFSVAHGEDALTLITCGGDPQAMVVALSQLENQCGLENHFFVHLNFPNVSEAFPYYQKLNKLHIDWLSIACENWEQSYLEEQIKKNEDDLMTLVKDYVNRQDSHNAPIEQDTLQWLIEKISTKQWLTDFVNIEHLDLDRLSEFIKGLGIDVKNWDQIINKFKTQFMQFFIYEEEIEELFQLMVEGGMPVLAHSGKTNYIKINSHKFFTELETRDRKEANEIYDRINDFWETEIKQ